MIKRERCACLQHKGQRRVTDVAQDAGCLLRSTGAWKGCKVSHMSQVVRWLCFRVSQVARQPNLHTARLCHATKCALLLSEDFFFLSETFLLGEDHVRQISTALLQSQSGCYATKPARCTALYLMIANFCEMSKDLLRSLASENIELQSGGPALHKAGDLPYRVMHVSMHVSAKLQEQNRLQTHRLKQSFTSRSLHVTERWKLCMKAANLGRARAGCVLRICNFGSSLVSYGEGLHLQQQLAQLCKERAIVDTVLLLQVTYCLFSRKRFRFSPTSFGVQQWTCARSTHQCILSESVGATRTFLQRQSCCGLRAQRYTRQTVAERSLFMAQGRQAICKLYSLHTATRHAVC